MTYTLPVVTLDVDELALVFASRERRKKKNKYFCTTHKIPSEDLNNLCVEENRMQNFNIITKIYAGGKH